MDVEATFRALFKRAYPALLRYASRRGLSRPDADDLVAATLEIAWRQADRLPSDPMPWLYGIAHNHLRNRWRADDRRDSLHTRLATMTTPGHDVEAAIVDSDALRTAFAQLDGDDQELLRLIAWEGLTPGEAAAAIGCSTTAARTRLHRARQRLASHLGYDPRVQRGARSEQLSSRRNPHPIALEASDDRRLP